jgi:hypothetical protein
MKRALFLAASLAAALALLWLCTQRAVPPEGPVPSPEAAASATPLAPESARTESETTAPALEHESATAPTRVQQPTERSAGEEALPGPKAEVQGRVVLARTQAPVDSGEVRLRFVLPGDEHAAQEAQPRDVGRVMLTTKLDGQGRFTFDLPVGTHLHGLTVAPLVPGDEHDGRSGSDASILFAPRQQPLNERLGEAGVELVVEVEAAVELRGLVRDAQNLAPLAGARISTADRPAAPASALSERDGSFVLGGLLPHAGGRSRSLRVERQDYLARRVPLPDEVLAAGAAALVVDLQRGLVVEGRVVDAQKLPVPGLSLRLLAVGFDTGLDYSASALPARTDERGEFRCAPVPPCSSLALEIEAQRRGGRDILALHRDLGPLRGDRSDLQLEVQSSGILEVHAQLADGTVLGPRDFQVICTNAHSVEPAGSNGEGLLLRVPLGVELELEAYASGKDVQDPATFVRGRGSARVDANGASQPGIRIVLGQRGSFVAPARKSGARELVLPDEEFLHATVDVQLLDARSGQPLESGRRVSLSGSGGSLMSSNIENGWVRVRGRPGKHVFEVEVDGGTHESLELVIPASGYGTAEWRVKVGP